MTSSSLQLVSASLGRVTKVGQPSARIAMSDVDVQWKNPVKQRLEDLIRLNEGWDGYKAFPVSFGNAYFALSMLESICRPDTPAPQIVPGSSGDLQIEWHTHQGDIELWVRGPYNVHAWYAKDDDDDGQEANLTIDFGVVSQWLKEVTEPEIAYAAAA